MSLTRRLVYLVAFAVVCAQPASAWGSGPFQGRGMWIWYVNRSDGGNPTAIAKQAQAQGIKTLFVKSGDGATYWSQFSRRLVYFIHRYGINICAWQYVYGSQPATEAAVAARAVRNGADCIAIDAEAEYEGRYASAQVYIDSLRAAVGQRYPVGLASFPYVDYHPSFPFSVFLGHGGATINLPQMYWRDIGSPVGAVFRHTYSVNGIYRRPIRPLGQTDNGATGSELELFRGLSVAYGAGGLSWWDYAWASNRDLWPAISGLYTSVASVPSPGVPVLKYGSAGDMVLWMQELLKSAIPAQRLTGTFASETQQNLRSFQLRHGIAPTGQTGPRTWHELLRLPAARAQWAATDVRASRARAGHRASHGQRRGPSEPQSASLPARAYEIHPATEP